MLSDQKILRIKPAVPGFCLRFQHGCLCSPAVSFYGTAVIFILHRAILVSSDMRYAHKEECALHLARRGKNAEAFPNITNSSQRSQPHGGLVRKQFLI